jgi:DNA polymerase-3 subunit delta
MSSPAALKALRHAITERKFEAAYLLFGDDDFRKGRAVHELIEAAIDPGTRDFNLEVRRGSDLDAESLGSMLNTPPLMAERRGVVIRDVGTLKKDARAALQRYLDRPSPDTLLVMVIPGGSKMESGLGAGVVSVEFEALEGDKVPKWIAQHAAHLGFSISPGAVALLHDSVGADLSQLNVELEKLGSYAGAREIAEEDVAAAVGVRRGETLADLVGAIVRRDARAAAGMVDLVLEQPKTSAVQVVMALGSQLLALRYVRARVDAGTRASSLKGDMFTVLKGSGGVFLGQAWGDAIDGWLRSVDRWSAAEIDAALSRVLATDRALKESRVSSEAQLILSLLLALCGSESSRRAA